jgi:predicted nuclease of predicted toxin-antitoxin system
MRFILDQDVPDTIARIIQQGGHEALRLREVLPVESTDEEVLAFAHVRESLLDTCNRDDFVALAKTKPHAGIIILVSLLPNRGRGRAAKQRQLRLN